MEDGEARAAMLWNRDAETLGRDALRALQTARLRDRVAYVAARVPFYRERFAAHGITPDGVRSLDDLVRLPFTTKSDLRSSTRSASSLCRRRRCCASTPPPARGGN